MDSSSYETDDLVHQYLLFHYGGHKEQLPWSFGPAEALDFPLRCVTEGVDPATLPGHARALDVGCAVGRAACALAGIFDEVIGIDYSAAFVDAARRLVEEGAIPYRVRETGTIMRERVARLPSGLSGTLRFEQGDAQDLRPDLGAFDCVLACNLLCRLARPDAFLQRLPDLLNPDGQLVITTPNTWLESFTAREFWIGATPETGEPLEALKARLDPAFELQLVWDMPFLIREHKRKYQWSVAQATRWRRRPS